MEPKKARPKKGRYIQKSHDDYEKSRKQEQIEKYKNQINNLTQVSDKYRQDYQQEKNILLFSLYEKQYTLHTKMVHLKSQKEITENLTKENENLQNIIRMYSVRFYMNQTTLIN